MHNLDYVAVFLSAGTQLKDAKVPELYLDYLANLVNVHGSTNKNILITRQFDELNMQSKKNLKIISLETETKGALTSLAFSLDYIENDIPIIVFPTNSIVKVDTAKFVENMKIENNQAGVICFKSDDANYSYIRVKEGKIIEFKEKEIIGDLATTGIFYFKNKQEIIKCLEWCLINNINNNGLYYLAPSLNYFVCNNMKIGLEIIPSQNYSRLDTIKDLRANRLDN